MIVTNEVMILNVIRSQILISSIGFSGLNLATMFGMPSTAHPG